METPLPATTQYLGKEGEDPSNPFWTSGNYVGPYWSDGKVQESVEWGDSPALHALDDLARQHDAAYARYKDDKHREAADMIFAQEAKKLKEKYGSKWADDPRIAARLVEYGNFTARTVKKLVRAAPYGLPGLLAYQVGNMVDNYKRIKGTYLKNEQSELKKFYETDPHRKIPIGTRVVPRIAPQPLDVNPKGATGWDLINPATVAAGVARKGFDKEETAYSKMSRDERNLVTVGQARRLRKHKKTYLDSVASAGQKATAYVKKKLNLDKAKPKRKKKNQVVAC